MNSNQPRLFGITNSNRDFSKYDTWGKNQFNSSFPASLACYLFSKKIKAVYVKADEELRSYTDYISIDELFGIDPLGRDTFFAFENQFIPFQKYVFGSLPRNDLVIQNLRTNQCVSSFEIKLTALPDNATCDQSENKYGSEIVIRPDTIIYLACNFIKKYKNISELKNIIQPIGNKISDWSDIKAVLPHIIPMLNNIRYIVASMNELQTPFIIEPIWKTKGKSPQLADNCLDVFVWSDFSMLNLFLPDGKSEITSISRHTRTMIWLFKMLYDYCNSDKFNGALIIDELSYNTKNDKAFSTNGVRTHDLMECSELITPRIMKSEIKNIILGGGQNLLSPERRFDAIIYNSPDLFN